MQLSIIVWPISIRITSAENKLKQTNKKISTFISTLSNSFILFKIVIRLQSLLKYNYKQRDDDSNKERMIVITVYIWVSLNYL